MKALLFSSILLLTGTGYSAAPSREHCLPAQEVTQILSELKLEGADRWTTDEVCNPQKLAYKTLQALIFIKNLELPEVSNSQLYPNLLGKNPWKFFSSRIKELKFQKNCQPGTLAYVLSQQQNNTAHLCPLLAQSEVSTFAGTLLHEARHVDGFNHVICTHGDRAGTPGACDLTLHEDGSYGLEIEWGLKLAKSDRISKVVQDQMRSSSVFLMLNRINEYPLEIQEGLALQALNGEVTFFDGKNQSLITAMASSDSVLTDRMGTPVFFDTRTTTISGYYFSPELLSVPGLIASYLSSASTTDKENLLDINYDKSLLLFKNKIVFATSAGQFIEVRHGINEPLLISAIHSLPPLKSGVYITAADGSIYKLPDNLNELTKKQPEFISKLQNQLIKIVQGVHGSNYVLMIDGSLAVLPGRWGYSPVPVETLKGQAFKNITPTLWSPLIEGL